MLTSGKHPCIARAVIASIAAEEITVSLTKKLQSCFQSDATSKWRLDKDEPSSNFVKMRSNFIGTSSRSVLCLCIVSWPLLKQFIGLCDHDDPDLDIAQVNGSVSDCIHPSTLHQPSTAVTPTPFYINLHTNNDDQQNNINDNNPPHLTCDTHQLNTLSSYADIQDAST